jgi:hypothetical protein
MKKLVLLLLIGCIAVLGCSDNKNKADVVAAAVAENVKSFKQEQYTECRSRIFDDASRIVDSILLEEARQRIMTRTDITVPARPDKPDKPEVRSPLDTVAVKPFFEKE